MPMPPRLTLLCAFALALMPGLSWALGLGGIRSDSALNEPFLGRIELNGIAAEELDTVKVTLASEADFTKAGSPRPQFLTRLAFVPEVSPDGQIQFLVTSPEPIREPYLDFLVEVTWPQGRLVKGYTVLLDPPADLKPPPGVAPLSMPVATTATSSQAAPSEPTAPMATPSVIQIPDPTPRSAGDLVSPSSLPPAGYPLRYGPVPSGSNLHAVARRLAPPGASVPQTALALFRANPQAFGGGDINKLKAGARLEIPYPDLIFGIDAETAKRQFQDAQHGDPLPPPLPLPPSAEALVRDRLEIASRAMRAEAEAGIAAPPSPPAAPEASSSIPDPEPALAQVEREILLVREMAESGRQETGELGERVGLLERQLEDIKHLLELSNAQLAMIQGLKPEGEILEPGTPEGESPELEYPGTKPLAGETPEEAVPAEDAPDEGASVGVEFEPAPTTPAATLVPTPVLAPDPSFFDDPSLSSWALVVGGPLLILLLGLLLLVRRQNRAKEAAWAEEGALGETPAVMVAARAVKDTEPVIIPALIPKAPPTDIPVINPQAPSVEPESLLDLAAGDFDLDLESLGKLDPASGSAGRDKSDEPVPDLDLDLDDLMDLDLSAFESADKTADQPRKAQTSEPDLGWGALGLSLETENNLSREFLAAGSPPDTGFPVDFQMESDPWDEVGIKLDLARAYLQMEDPEAARALLDEAIAEGTEEQIAEAKAMLARLE